MDVTLLEQVLPHGLPGSPLKEHVVRHDDGGPSVDREQRLDVLDEVELLVRGGRPEVRAVVGQRLAVGLALLVDDRDRGLPAERRIGHDHLRMGTRLVAEGIVGLDEPLITGIRPDAVQEEIHPAEP